MNNVWTITSRPASSCLKSATWNAFRPPSVVKRVVDVVLRERRVCARTHATASYSRLPIPSRFTAPAVKTNPVKLSNAIRSRQFHQTFAVQKLKPYKPANEEKGLRFRAGDLTLSELEDVFGPDVPEPRFANRLLRILHGRRVDGTLDLDPPEDISVELPNYPEAVPDALQWLQENYPVDEDEAIQRRIAREETKLEQESPAELMQRAERIGLYKPQSGNYQAKLSEKGDVFGESALEKLKAANIAKAQQDEQELEQKIDEIQQDIQKVAQSKKSNALTQAGDRDLEVSTDETRRPNTYEKWVLRARNKATSDLTLDSPEIQNMTSTQRLLPSFIFALTVAGLSYLFAQYWVPPKRSERLMPSTSLSFATYTGILGANLLVFMLWRYPPAWRMLNKYFVNVPGQPRALSMLGNVFSHQKILHLFVNLGFLFSIGLSLHEDVGRGTFLGVFLAGGVISSFASLTSFVARGLLVSSSVGASGAVAAIIGMFGFIHATDPFELRFIPENRQPPIYGWMLLGGLVVLDLFRYLSPLKTVDYASHLGGYVVGIVCGWWWKSNEDPTSLSKRKARNETLFEKYFVKSSDNEDAVMMSDHQVDRG